MAELRNPYTKKPLVMKPGVPDKKNPSLQPGLDRPLPLVQDQKLKREIPKDLPELKAKLLSATQPQQTIPTGNTNMDTFNSLPVGARNQIKSALAAGNKVEAQKLYKQFTTPTEKTGTSTVPAATSVSTTTSTTPKTTPTNTTSTPPKTTPTNTISTPPKTTPTNTTSTPPKTTPTSTTTGTPHKITNNADGTQTISNNKKNNQPSNLSIYNKETQDWIKNDQAIKTKKWDEKISTQQQYNQAIQSILDSLGAEFGPKYEDMRNDIATFEQRAEEAYNKMKQFDEKRYALGVQSFTRRHAGDKASQASQLSAKGFTPDQINSMMKELDQDPAFIEKQKQVADTYVQNLQNTQNAYKGWYDTIMQDKSNLTQTELNLAEKIKDKMMTLESDINTIRQDKINDVSGTEEGVSTAIGEEIKKDETQSQSDERKETLFKSGNQSAIKAELSRNLYSSSGDNLQNYLTMDDWNEALKKGSYMDALLYLKQVAGEKMREEQTDANTGLGGNINNSLDQLHSFMEGQDPNKFNSSVGKWNGDTFEYNKGGKIKFILNGKDIVGYQYYNPKTGKWSEITELGKPANFGSEDKGTQSTTSKYLSGAGKATTVGVFGALGAAAVAGLGYGSWKGSQWMWDKTKKVFKITKPNGSTVEIPGTSTAMTIYQGGDDAKKILIQKGFSENEAQGIVNQIKKGKVTIDSKGNITGTPSNAKTESEVIPNNKKNTKGTTPKPESEVIPNNKKNTGTAVAKEGVTAFEQSWTKDKAKIIKKFDKDGKLGLSKAKNANEALKIISKQKGGTGFIKSLGKAGSRLGSFLMLGSPILEMIGESQYQKLKTTDPYKYYLIGIAEGRYTGGGWIGSSGQLNKDKQDPIYQEAYNDFIQIYGGDESTLNRAGIYSA